MRKEKTCHHCEEENNSKELIKIIVSIILLVISFFIKTNSIKTILLLISYLVVGLDIILKAIKNISKGEIIEENFLMSIASIGAILIHELPEAVAVMLFYQIGEYFQDRATDKSKKHIRELMNIRPDYATVLRNSKEVKVSPEEVKIEEIIIVKPGEKIPLDGIVKKGTSTLNTVAITGESIPTEVSIDSKIISGTINLTSTLEIEVTHTFKESTVSKILNMVENAKEKKAKNEKFITKFSKIYTPVVVILAIIVSILPPLITSSPLKVWIYKGLSFLVASCPCALVISIPLSFMAGIGISAKNGILIKGSNYLEELTKVKTIAFDKTGTLTEGIFKVEKINSLHLKKEELLEYACMAEYHSNHPIAISLKEAYQKAIDDKKIEKMTNLSGLGIKATIDKKEVLVGNQKLMDKYNIEYPTSKEIGTIIYIAINNQYEGNIIINDKIKSNAKETLEILNNQYNINTFMLTGDKEIVAKKIKDELKINEYKAELLPQEKVEELKRIKEKNNYPVAFVGDGINDAPVLSLANIGISMGSLGSDAAIEASDIIIMEDNLSKIPTALYIAKKTITIAKENIIFAITIKLLILLLSILGITSMWYAVFADVGVSIIAIANSLRLLRLKIDK